MVAGAWKEAHFDGYKPSSRRGISVLLNGRLLPAFGLKPLDRITRARVRKWFDAFSRTAPGNANHALATLRQIMNFAIACGHIGVNPARSLKMNRRPALTRFLSREEVARLHDVLDGQVRKGGRQQADMIWLLLLTGCRRSEIVNLRRSEVRADMLELEDSKTGPRRVPLSAAAGVSWKGNRRIRARSCFRRPSIPTGRAVQNSRSGTGFAGKPESRMSAFTISDTRSPAMRS